MSDFKKHLQAGAWWATYPACFILQKSFWMFYKLAPRALVDMVLGCLKEKLGREMEDAIPYITSNTMLVKNIQKFVLDIYKEAKLGSQAPDAKVIKLEDGKEVNLLSFARAGRPLLINFGSCS